MEVYIPWTTAGPKTNDRLKKLGLKNDFYLAHDMREKLYSEEWRLYYPKDFEQPGNLS